MREATVAVSVSALALSLAACGSLLDSDDDGTSQTERKGDAVTVGLLLPEAETARYEKFDHPIIEKQVKKLTNGKGKLVYANAKGDAAKQNGQLAQMVADKVDAILVSAVDAKKLAPAVKKAKEADIPVIAYDRLAEGPVSGYVAFDNELVGQVQGQAILKALGGDRQNSKIVMINGAPTDPNAAVFKEGALSQLKNQVDIAKSYDTDGWKPQTAGTHMTDAITAIGKDNIAAVYSANDGMAGGAIKALKAAGITDLPPVTGQDAELPAVQRIVTGEQYMSVYKPYPEEAVGAAEMAVRIAQGRMVEYDALAGDRSENATTKNIPSLLVSVRPLTRDTIKSTVIKDGIYKTKEICTAELKAACATVGLKG
ncbi:sugar ABC transporter substrate-binding protein [Streptomyces sp. BA2]|uniref:sugar ABC transporter substrate-binding protein n=1 Tax=Streptomyces sp. BA2 TaxID=436595 RepID=UPI0013261D1F|nr:substrate-binding domain-containing protein [Streptomyces sp. BA2]MWA15541.1 substrate-binding domain-containing protein [Streptomyces sp. BA2]